MKPGVTVTSTGDLQFFKDAIDSLDNAAVYIGIPEADTDRNNPAPGVTNAGLLYIFSNGSQLNNQPPRSVIEASIEANRNDYQERLNQIADDVFQGNKGEANRKLKQLGTLGANNAKRWFTDPRNGWAQNAPSTIRKKLAKLTGKRYRKAIKILDSVQQHMPTYSTTPLDTINTPGIDTAEMRRAITHVEKAIK